MSFRCENCTKSQEAGVQPHKRVTKTRNVTYENGSHGTEIVREKVLCEQCANQIDKQQE